MSEHAVSLQGPESPAPVLLPDSAVRLPTPSRLQQLESRGRWRGTLAGCRVILCEHLDGRLTIHYGPHLVATFSASQPPRKKGADPSNGKE